MDDLRIVWLRRLSPSSATHAYLDSDEARDVTSLCGLVSRIGAAEWVEVASSVRCGLCERREARVLEGARMRAPGDRNRARSSGPRDLEGER